MGAYKEPHGGELKELYLPADEAEQEKLKAKDYLSWDLTPASCATSTCYSTVLSRRWMASSVRPTMTPCARACAWSTACCGRCPLRWT